MPSLGAPLGEAQRAGASGLILALIAAALGAAGLGRFRARRCGGAVADRGGAGRRRGLAAGGGARARRRAGGGARLRRRLVGRLYGFAVLASRRIALSRLTMLLVIGASAVAVDRGLVDPPRALAWALGVNLALVTPAVALALAERGGPRSVAVLLATAAIMFAAALLGPDWRSAPAQQILVAALVAGAIGLLAGALSALFERRDPPSDATLRPVRRSALLRAGMSAQAVSSRFACS